jgi:hypothetical protein
LNSSNSIGSLIIVGIPHHLVASAASCLAGTGLKTIPSNAITHLWTRVPGSHAALALADPTQSASYVSPAEAEWRENAGISQDPLAYSNYARESRSSAVHFMQSI